MPLWHIWKAANLAQRVKLCLFVCFRIYWGVSKETNLASWGHANYSLNQSRPFRNPPACQLHFCVAAHISPSEIVMFMLWETRMTSPLRSGEMDPAHNPTACQTKLQSSQYHWLVSSLSSHTSTVSWLSTQDCRLASQHCTLASYTMLNIQTVHLRAFWILSVRGFRLYTGLNI